MSILSRQKRFFYVWPKSWSFIFYNMLCLVFSSLVCPNKNYSDFLEKLDILVVSPPSTLRKCSPWVTFVSFFTLTDPKDPIAIERLNLMNMAKLSIKGLIESALNLGRTLDSDYAPLQQFFVVMEHCLKHGLKSKSTHIKPPSVIYSPNTMKLSGILTI